MPRQDYMDRKLASRPPRVATASAHLAESHRDAFRQSADHQGRGLRLLAPERVVLRNDLHGLFPVSVRGQARRFLAPLLQTVFPSQNQQRASALPVPVWAVAITSLAKRILPLPASRTFAAQPFQSPVTSNDLLRADESDARSMHAMVLSVDCGDMK